MSSKTGEPASATVLVVDDDPTLRRLVSYSLTQEGYRVITAADGQEGLRTMFETRPDLLVLDVGMPNMDGWTMCQRVREISNVPIIMLTASSETEYVVKGLELGADDYITKPFEMRELLARVRANLRRAATQPTRVKEKVIYSDDWLTVNLEEHRVLVQGEAVRLTPTEFNLLAQLVTAAPRVVSYRDLLEQVWGWEYIDDIDYLRVYVWHLRRKLEPDPKEPVYVVNELGVGYRFEGKK
ncbi:MAG: response regulator transcription factor [Anaerolineae bacterium]|nr:response regulator transcription factor [Anaerolineae bacterium]